MIDIFFQSCVDRVCLSVCSGYTRSEFITFQRFRPFADTALASVCVPTLKTHAQIMDMISVLENTKKLMTGSSEPCWVSNPRLHVPVKQIIFRTRGTQSISKGAIIPAGTLHFLDQGIMKHCFCPTQFTG